MYPLLDFMYKWYYMVFVFLWLTSLSMRISKFIHVAANGIISIFMAKYYSILYTYHFVFIHSSVNGHLAYFYVLPIANSAALNIGVHVYCEITVLSGFIPWKEFLDHFIILVLLFWGTSVLFPIVAAPTYFHTKCVAVFPSIHILSSICYL